MVSAIPAKLLAWQVKRAESSANVSSIVRQQVPSRSLNFV